MTRLTCVHNPNDYLICRKCAPYITAAYADPSQPVASSPAAANDGAA